MGAAIRPFGSPRVFLAEDHAVLRLALKTLLQHEGFLVVGEASNGRQALQRCAILRPDVAVLDLSMPELNGIDTARAIVAVSPLTRIVLLTSYLEDCILHAGSRAGVRGYVSRVHATRELGQAICAVHSGGSYPAVISEPIC